MKKMVVFLLLLLSVFLMGAASADTFVPSIGDKPAPEVEAVEVDGNQLSGYLVVTPVIKAYEGTAMIPEEDHELLREVYEQLISGEMESPVDNNHAIRELVDLSFALPDYAESESMKRWLAEEGNTIMVTLDLGVDEETEVTVMVYVSNQRRLFALRNLSATIGEPTYTEGEWKPAISVENNGDGTVTCELEDIGIVAFCVKESRVQSVVLPQDTCIYDITIWVVMMAGSLVLIFVLMICRRRFVRRKEMELVS